MKTLIDILESSMTSLYESIFDTFDDEGNVTTDSSEFIKQGIIDWIKENYRVSYGNIKDKLTIDSKDDNGKYIVNYTDRGIFKGLRLDNKKLKQLTNGQFVWGIVKGLFDCARSDIKSLEGAPAYVEGSFMCHLCPSLTTLEGAPEYVGGGFSCDNNEKLKSLKGAPEYVGGDFNCYRCGKKFTETDVKKVSRVKNSIRV